MNWSHNNLPAGVRTTIVQGRQILKEMNETGSAKVDVPDYTISIFIEGHPGFFRYKVGTRDQAMAHFAAITSGGYRRLNDRGQFTWYSPHLIRAIKIDGPGLETSYPDQFVRT